MALLFFFFCHKRKQTEFDFNPPEYQQIPRAFPGTNSPQPPAQETS